VISNAALQLLPLRDCHAAPYTPLLIVGDGVREAFDTYRARLADSHGFSGVLVVVRFFVILGVPKELAGIYGTRDSGGCC